jgi:leucyl aminopeptidase
LILQRRNRATYLTGEKEIHQDNMKAYEAAVPVQIKIVSNNEQNSKYQVILKAASMQKEVKFPSEKIGDFFLETSGSITSLTFSLGKAESINADTFRQVGGALAHWIKQYTPPTIDIDLNQFSDFQVSEAFEAFCEGVYLGAFEFQRYKSGEKKVDETTILLRGSSKPEIERLQEIKVICTAVNMARDWGHEPANVINPQSLAERVVELAFDFGLKCTVLDDSVLTDMKAGGILAVGQGSKTPARMIVLEYSGDNPAGSEAAPVILVGKAITFDTGGYSLKSVENIQGMKGDKCGGLAVISTLRAAAELKLKTPIVGIICAAENMISAQSYRPDDIITTLSGKTIEIITTDAEGRIVLADGLTYAQQAYHPRVIIDLATLTGGVITALGRVRAGFMSNHEELAENLSFAGEQTCERLWRLPLDDDYAQLIKGTDADLKNSGGREAHPVIGGIFLKQFVSDSIPWAHLDIAGVAETNKDLPYCPKGATGFGVRLLINYLQELALH